MSNSTSFVHPSVGGTDPFAGVTTLGAIQGRHDITGAARYGAFIFGGLLIAGALGFLVGGFTERDQGFFIGFALTGLFGALCVWLGLRNLGLAAALYEGGFAYADRAGTRIVPWENITATRSQITKQYVNGVYTGTTYIFHVDTSDGAHLKLDNRFKGIEQLGNTIVRVASSRLLPPLAAAFDRGERVSFGPIALDRQGLTTGSKSLAWHEVRSAGLEQGVLVVRSNDSRWAWAKIPCSGIGNLYVLMALLQRKVPAA